MFSRLIATKAGGISNAVTMGFTMGTLAPSLFVQLVVIHSLDRYYKWNLKRGLDTEILTRIKLGD